MGKSTISMVIFNSFWHNQRVYPNNIPLNHHKTHENPMKTPNYPDYLLPFLPFSCWQSNALRRSAGATCGHQALPGTWLSKMAMAARRPVLGPGGHISHLSLTYRCICVYSDGQSLGTYFGKKNIWLFCRQWRSKWWILYVLRGTLRTSKYQDSSLRTYRGI